MSLSSTAVLNSACAAFTAAGPDLSVHTATTGTTGTNEVAGGSYARQAASWTAPSAGAADNGAALSYSIPASTTCAYAGTWSLTSGGVFAKGMPLTSSITFQNPGTLTFAEAAVTLTVTDSQS